MWPEHDDGDAVGNQTDDGKDYTYKYDVFGRLREVWTRGGGAALRSEFRYNGLGFRIGWHYDADADNDVDNNDAWFYWMHDERCRQIARLGHPPKERFVYHAAGLDGLGGSSYIDAVVLRDRDANTDWNGTARDGVLVRRHQAAALHPTLRLARSYPNRTPDTHAGPSLNSHT